MQMYTYSQLKIHNKIIKLDMNLSSNDIGYNKFALLKSIHS